MSPYLSVITAPQPFQNPEGHVSMFLAGGISNCPNWQDEIIREFSQYSYPVTFVNPRRDTGLEKTGEEASTQIQWEYDALRRSDAVLFWFPKESICPIALFELGAALERNQQVFIGTDPEYSRRFDILEQTKIQRPELTIVDSLDRLMNQIKTYILRGTTH